MKVRQIFTEGYDSNFSYLIYDELTGEAVIIDPCGNTDLIKEECERVSNIKPKYILLTHGHSDHISGISDVKKFFNAPVAAHQNSLVKRQISLKHREMLPLGNSFIECLHTPGHTEDSVIYRLNDDSAIFTGDTLFIDFCGYCDARTMFKTIKEIIFPLADSNIVFSGHDYGRTPFAPLGKEKISNPFLSAKTLADFEAKLKEL